MTKNFGLLQQECLDEVRNVGIKTGTVRAWEINTRARKRWGHCKKEIDGTFTIQIAKQLLEDDRITEKSCKETMIHELLHTCSGCMNHQAKWKSYAQLMNDTYGYNIKRATSASEKGVEEEKTKPMKVKYMFVCSGCGAQIYRKRKSRFTRYYRQYICTRCGTQGWKRFEV